MMKHDFKSAGDVTAPASAVQAGLIGAVPRPVALRDGSITLAMLIDRYMASYAGRDPTRVQRLGWWRDRLGHLTLGEIDDDDVFDSMQALAQRHGAFYAGKDVDGKAVMRAKRKVISPATLNRYQAALSAALTWAQRQRIAPKSFINPCRMVELKKERNARVRFLTDDERNRLLAACRGSKWDRLYLLVLLALTTGARRGELEALRWVDVDLARSEATVPIVTKNSDAKMLPLTSTVVAEMQKFVGAPSALIFASKRRPNQPRNSVPAWQLALRTAGIKDFRFHDCRHDAASTLARSGASLLEIGDLLGHRQVQVTRRYAHLCTSHKKALVSRVLGSVG